MENLSNELYDFIYYLQAAIRYERYRAPLADLNDFFINNFYTRRLFISAIYFMQYGLIVVLKSL